MPSSQVLSGRTKVCRTAEVELTLVASDGTALAGREVTIRQTRHKFLFGCDVFLLLARFDLSALPHTPAVLTDDVKRLLNMDCGGGR